MYAVEMKFEDLKIIILGIQRPDAYSKIGCSYRMRVPALLIKEVWLYVTMTTLVNERWTLKPFTLTWIIWEAVASYLV